ncbi:ATP-binding protein [Streptomyces sp. NPDC012769]|uniref:ATP-binding protein n=1 Tax=Streptomyces sp. NPDC012769 TaxID=3364848 RepID=UPI0036931065
MNIDPTQPWGVAIDYAGRTVVTENGHTLNIRVYDNSLGYTLERDPITGQYPSVYVTAEFSEKGAGDASLRGSGTVTVVAKDGAPAVPDATAVQQAVTDALADFETRRAAYAALCASWAPAPAPETPRTPESPETPAEPAPAQPAPETPVTEPAA